MSWQAYVDNLTGTGKVDQAALYSRAGDSVWAQSPGFDVSADEIGAIAKGFDNPDSLHANGLRVLGQKYVVIRADEEQIQGKFGETGVIAIRTKQAIILAHYPEGAGNTSEATNVVVNIADYLKKSGY